MKNAIQRLMRTNGSSTGLSGFLSSVKSEQQSNGGTSLIGGVRTGIALESMSEAEQEQAGSGLDRLRVALEGHASNAGFTALSPARREAALAGALISQAGKSYLRGSAPAMSQDEFNVVVPANGGVDRLSTALEAYDDASNRNMAAYTVTYNMQAAQQDKFGEAFYPTVVVTRDQVGYLISIQLITVMDELRRQTSGDVDDFKRKNIVFALRDPDILRNNQTEIIPVYRTEAANKFVDAALIPHSTVDQNGEAVVTGALKFGTQMSLIALSQVDSLVASGLMDSTDAVDRDVHLKGVYLQLEDATGSVVYFPTKDLYTANFVYNPQGSEKRVTLNFENKSVMVKNGIKAIDGSAPPELALVVDGVEVRLQMMVSGSLDLQTGTLNLLAGEVGVFSVTKDGVRYVNSATNPAGIIAIFNAFTGSKLIGYNLDARRTNSNRRQRGDLLDITVYNQCYSVPLLSPITAPRPLGQGDDTDTSDLNALITTTRIRASNGAVDELLRVKDVLSRYAGEQGLVGDTLEILGVARYLISPFYEEFDLDLTDIVNSVNSHTLSEDIQQAIVNKMREMSYRMVRDSGWRQAASALNGGNDVNPIVLAGTDQVTEGWLMVTGDLRTLGEGVSLEIVSTPNKLMNGKIVMTLKAPNASEGVPNVLNFGNMAYQPELVLALPIHRNGANSKELTVQPAFRHITNLPIMSVINITGYEGVIDKKVEIHNRVMV